MGSLFQGKYIYIIKSENVGDEVVMLKVVAHMQASFHVRIWNFSERVVEMGSVYLPVTMGLF